MSHTRSWSEAWREAACTGHHPGIWQETEPEYDEMKAKSICLGDPVKGDPACPIYKQCLDLIRDSEGNSTEGNAYRSGIWAGYTVVERTKGFRRTRQPTPVRASRTFLTADQQAERLALYNLLLSDAEIGARSDVSADVIRHWRIRNDLEANKTHRAMTDDENTERMRMYNAGATDREMAQRAGVAVTAIERWRNRTGGGLKKNKHTAVTL